MESLSLPNQGALLPYTILDLSEGGHNICGRLLGDMGARVVRIEPPGGSQTRLRGPLPSIQVVISKVYTGQLITPTKKESRFLLILKQEDKYSLG